jgi:glutathione S-transferase
MPIPILPKIQSMGEAIILVGRNLSPFVRRTSVVLRYLGLKYEQKMLSTADDLADILKNNPVGRVPTLILDDGETLIDSGAIIDHLVEIHDGDRRLLPAFGAARRAALRTTALAHGVMEKAFHRRTSAIADQPKRSIRNG